VPEEEREPEPEGGTDGMAEGGNDIEGPVTPTPPPGGATPATAASAGGAPGKPTEPAQPAKRKGSFLAELPVLVLVAFVLAILMKTFLVQAFYIPSSSMEPTLLVQDRVLVNKLSYTFREPRRGEVMVFSDRGFNPLAEDTGVIEGIIESLRSGVGLTPPTEKDFIKRIIGLPGETIEMREGVVHVDGVPIEEAPTGEGGYLSARDLTDFGPVTVPEGQFFMMGDNRPFSADSRSSLGTIPREDIIGRAFVVIWPVDRLSILPINSYDGVPAEADAAAEEETAARSTLALAS
jgi:signal peptidase I